MVPYAQLRPHSKWHLDWFSRFCRAHDCNRQTDRPTDHAAPSVAIDSICLIMRSTTTITTILQPFFQDHPGEPVPEENFWTLWCKGRLTEKLNCIMDHTDTDTPTIRLGTTPSGLSSARLHDPPCFLQAGCPSCRPTNSVKALKAKCNRVILQCGLIIT